MHIYNSNGRHAWFHLHGASRPARSASEATKYKMKNSLFTVGLEPTTLRFKVWCSTDWASRAWWMLSIYMTLLHTYTPNINVYIIITTRMTKDSVFCLVNVLFCVTYWNIIYKCCTNSKETHKSCACFQYANTAKHSTWSSICTFKASTGPMRHLLFVKYTFIPICNTKQYIYKTDYALLHRSGTYNNVNIGIWSTWM